jgi:hypothetical protein
MTLKRRSSRIKKQIQKKRQESIVILVGSENGSTLVFAKCRFKNNLLRQEIKVFITELNSYQSCPQAEYILVFSNTWFR